METPRFTTDKELLNKFPSNMYDNASQRELFDLSKKLLQTENGTAAETAADLRRCLVYHEWRYYVLNDAVLSDYEYDHLYKKLEALEAAFPNLITSDSPTQRVSSDLTEDSSRVEHLTPMLSLGNSYNAEDLNEFDTQIRKMALIEEGVDIAYVVEPKFDGGSLALVYENDLLARAATRGDGQKGEEMTPNARSMKSIPLRANFSKFGIHTVELRGEAVIRRDRFEKNLPSRKFGFGLLASNQCVINFTLDRGVENLAKDPAGACKFNNVHDRKIWTGKGLV